MNYIALINSFWDSAILSPLSTGQVSLYMALLHINNRSNWIEWFTAPNQVLSVLTGLSRSGILKARNELKQRGLIDFRERGTKATVYKITTMSNSTQDSNQNGNQDSEQDSNQNCGKNSSTLNKQKQKQKQKNIANAIQERYVSDDCLNDTIITFAEYRKSIKAPMTPHAIDLMLKSLEELAPGDDKTKIRILNQSIVNGWKGVFALKDKEKPIQSGQPKNQFHNFDQRDTDYDALMLKQVKDWVGEETHEGNT